MAAPMAEITVGALVSRADDGAPSGALAALGELRREADRREALVVGAPGCGASRGRCAR